MSRCDQFYNLVTAQAAAARRAEENGGEAGRHIFVWVRGERREDGSEKKTFLVGTVEQATLELSYPLNDLCEVIPTKTPAPLIMDIEWYFVSATEARSRALAAIEDIVRGLLDFINETIVWDEYQFSQITADDICVEESIGSVLTGDPFKASFHVKVFRLGFQTLKLQQFNFVFLFVDYLLLHRARYAKIPSEFFLHHGDLRKKCKDHPDVDPLVLMEQAHAKRMDDGSPPHGMTGVDLAIYTSNRIMRCCGVSKSVLNPLLAARPKSPRFFRPCLVTDYWAKTINRSFLQPAFLDAEMPTRAARKAWFLGSILCTRTQSFESTFPPILCERRFKQTLDMFEDGTPDYAAFNRPVSIWWNGAYSVDYAKTAIAPRRVVPIRRPNNARNAANPQVRNPTNVSVGVPEPSFFLRFTGHDELVIQSFRRLDGVWWEVNNGEPRRCDGEEEMIIENERRGVSVNKGSVFMQYAKAMLAMRYYDVKSRMETVTEDERKTLRTEMSKIAGEARKITHMGHKEICGYSEESITSMFTEEAVVYISPTFPVFDAMAWKWKRLSDIHTKTSILCPRHEVHGDDSHNASAFVGTTISGRKIIYCSVCSQQADGTRIMRERDGEEEGMAGFVDMGIATTRISSPRLEPEMLLPPKELWPTIRRKAAIDGRPFVFCLLSGMGSGKTFAQKLLFNERRYLINEMLGKEARFAPLQIVAACARVMIARKISNDWRLLNYNEIKRDARKEEIRWKNAEEEDRSPVPPESASARLGASRNLAMCITSFPLLTNRTVKYDIVAVDEARMVADHNVSKIVRAELNNVAKSFDAVVREARFVIVGAADLDAASIKVLFPGHPWHDPSKAMLLYNDGARGGIYDHQFVFVPDFHDVVKLLHACLVANKKVFIPVSTPLFMSVVEGYIVQHFPHLVVMTVSRDSPSAIRNGLSGDDPTSFLRRKGVDVLVATPILSTGFSFDRGLFDTVIGMFQAQPSITDSYIQAMARIRGLNDGIVFAWYQTWAPDHKLAFAYTARQFVDAATQYDVAVETVVGEFLNADISWRKFAALRLADELLMERLGPGKFLTKMCESTGKNVIPLSAFWTHAQDYALVKRAFDEVPIDNIDNWKMLTKDHRRAQKESDGTDLSQMTTATGMLELARFPREKTRIETKGLRIFRATTLPPGVFTARELRAHDFVDGVQGLADVLLAHLEGGGEFLAHLDASRIRKAKGSNVELGDRRSLHYQFAELHATVLQALLPTQKHDSFGPIQALLCLVADGNGEIILDYLPEDIAANVQSFCSKHPEVVVAIRSPNARRMFPFAGIDVWKAALEGKGLTRATVRDAMVKGLNLFGDVGMRRKKKIRVHGSAVQDDEQAIILNFNGFDRKFNLAITSLSDTEEKLNRLAARFDRFSWLRILVPSWAEIMRLRNGQTSMWNYVDHQSQQQQAPPLPADPADTVLELTGEELSQDW